MADYTASAFLDRNGQYAKVFEDVVTVRLFTGSACEHRDMPIAEFKQLTAPEQRALRLLSGRPECL